MNDARTTHSSGDSAEQLREQRRAAATLAEYIHEISGRHATAPEDPAPDPEEDR